MARLTMGLRDFGIEDVGEFGDAMAELFDSMYPRLAFDDPLLRPREALKFCDAARDGAQYFDVPDELILRTMLARRAESGPVRPLAP